MNKKIPNEIIFQKNEKLVQKIQTSISKFIIDKLKMKLIDETQEHRICSKKNWWINNQLKNIG